MRVSEIEEEIRALMAAFPDLHRSDLAPATSVCGRGLSEILPGDRRLRPRRGRGNARPDNASDRYATRTSGRVEGPHQPQRS